MARRADPLLSGFSQGYLITIAHRILYHPGGPDYVLALSAPPRVAVLAGPGALFPPSEPTGLQLALGVTPPLRRTGQPEGPGPTWPGPSGLLNQSA
jgi:hypothetical protein